MTMPTSRRYRNRIDPDPVAGLLINVEAFRAKVEKDGPIARQGLDPCWVWTGAIFEHRGGYGAFGARRLLDDGTTRKVILKAHRVSFVLEHRREPIGVLRHQCDNPPCVRGDHLLEGTHGDNVRDKTERDRVPFGEGHHGAKLTKQEVLAMREARAAGTPIASLASTYSVSKGSVSMICSGQRWRRA